MMRIIIVLLVLLSCSDKKTISNSNDTDAMLTYKLLIKGVVNDAKLTCFEEKQACQNSLPFLEDTNEFIKTNDLKTNLLAILKIKEYKSDSINYSIELFKINRSDTLRVLNGGTFKQQYDCELVSKTLCKLINK